MEFSIIFNLVGPIPSDTTFSCNHNYIKSPACFGRYPSSAVGYVNETLVYYYNEVVFTPVHIFSVFSDLLAAQFYFKITLEQ